MAWRRWITWCDLAKEEHRHLNVYDPPMEVFCTFLDFNLALYKPGTVTSYMKRVNTAAGERVGYPITRNLNKLWIKRTYNAAAKRYGYRGSKQRLPLTLDILVKLRPHLDFNEHDDRALWAILCVGIFTLARIGELVPGPASQLKVSLGAVSIKNDRGALFLVGTKTDRERKGVNLLFFRNNSRCCPIAAMQAYLSARPRGDKNSPLFVDKRNARISQSWVVSRLRTLLDKAGMRGKEFSGISLRRGGAQTLIRLKANDKIVMGMGRWTSSCFNRYLQVQEQDIQQWQKEMAQVI